MGSHRLIADAEDAALAPSASSISCARVSILDVLPSTSPYAPIGHPSRGSAPRKHHVQATFRGCFRAAADTKRWRHKWEIPPIAPGHLAFLRWAPTIPDLEGGSS